MQDQQLEGTEVVERTDLLDGLGVGSQSAFKGSIELLDVLHLSGESVCAICHTSCRVAEPGPTSIAEKSGAEAARRVDNECSCS